MQTNLAKRACNKCAMLLMMGRCAAADDPNCIGCKRFLPIKKGMTK